MSQLTKDSYTHYFSSGYDDKTRFVSYFHQSIELINLHPQSILEIGTGNKMVYRYLKERNWNITSIDIDEALEPDMVGSVTDLPFEDDAYDVVACYEVLEHLPFDQIDLALSEIYRVCTRAAVISIPDQRPVFRVFVHSPSRTLIRRLVPVPAFLQWLWKTPSATVDPSDHRTYHHWEVGALGYTLSKLTDKFIASGFKISKQYRLFENPYHHFFVLRKS